MFKDILPHFYNNPIIHQIKKSIHELVSPPLLEFLCQELLINHPYPYAVSLILLAATAQAMLSFAYFLHFIFHIVIKVKKMFCLFKIALSRK